MPIDSKAVSAPPSPNAGEVRRPGPVKGRSPFYVAHAVLMMAIVIWGFFPYFGPLLTQGAAPLPFQNWAIHLHSTVNMGWMFLYTALAVLAWRHRIDLHRRFGPYAAAYGVLVTVVGLGAGFVLALRRNEIGTGPDDAAAFLLIVLTDMLMFAGFLAAGVHNRKRPEVHKRLMVLATWTLAHVGASRVRGRVLLPLMPEWVADLVVLTPVFLLVGHDLLTRRRVHPVSLIGLLVFGLILFRRDFAESEMWLPIGRAVLKPFL
jgi:hypothetical protein